MSGTPYPCPLCGAVHDEARRICPTTGKRIPDPAGGALDGTEVQLVGSTVGKRFFVRGILGQGGMAAVFEATDKEKNRIVALKVLRQKHARNRVSVKRLLREAKLAATLKHPNICQVLHMDTLEDGTPYLAMERLYGETLAQRLTRDKYLPFEEVVQIMMQVLDALSTAHGRGIVHRDITPGNVFLVEATGPNGEGAAAMRARGTHIKILDFGFSKLLVNSEDEGTETGLTGEGIVVGTPHYMSPEQIRGDKLLDGRCDLFAVGAVMYRAVTGERPFSGPTMSAVLHSILTKTPPPPTQLRPDLPPGIDLVLQSAMERDKSKRFRSAGDFRSALMAFGVDEPKRPPAPAESARSAPRPDALTFDVFEQQESGDYGRKPDSIEIEFSSSVEPTEKRPAAPAAPPTKRANLPPMRPKADTAPPATTVDPFVAPVPEDEMATVERNLAVDELLELDENDGLEASTVDIPTKPKPRPNPPPIPAGPPTLRQEEAVTARPDELGAKPAARTPAADDDAKKFRLPPIPRPPRK